MTDQTDQGWQPITFEAFGLRACERQPEWYRYVSDVAAHDAAAPTLFPFVCRAFTSRFPWELASPPSTTRG